jgi:hypothetical protein
VVREREREEDRAEGSSSSSSSKTERGNRARKLVNGGFLTLFPSSRTIATPPFHDLFFQLARATRKREESTGAARGSGVGFGGGVRR